MKKIIYKYNLREENMNFIKKEQKNKVCETPEKNSM